ncbi:MAG: potassium transporter TrkG [Candidatus Latescibacterota bacterium]
MLLVLMIAGNLNFATAYLLLQRRFRAVGRNGEVRLVAALIPASALAAFLLTCWHLYPTLGKGVRVALFETVSALTTTGFQTVGYGEWSTAGVLVLIVLMLVGGGTCSTAGGLKQSRVYLLWRALVWEVRRRGQPYAAVLPLRIWDGERPASVDDAQLREAALYGGLYVATILGGTLAIAACGHSLQSALFECASALGTVGLSVGVTSAQAPPAMLWTQIACMLLGRLEFFVVLVSLAKIARDVRDMGLGAWRGAGRASAVRQPQPG